MVETVPFTREGYDELKRELTRLKAEDRPRIITEIAEARAHGDLSENAEYHAAREKQGLIEARISLLDDHISRAQVIDTPPVRDAVRFGAFITLVDEDSEEPKTFRIVGEVEADINRNRISMNSPLGRALLGKRVDEEVEFSAPKGTVRYLISAISYQP